MPEMQVVINVQGGLVQEVFASEPLAELVVVDWDVTPGDHQAVEVKMGRRQLRASVQHPMVQPIGHLAAARQVQAKLTWYEEVAVDPIG